MVDRVITDAATSIAAFIGHFDVASPRRVRSWSEFGNGVKGARSTAVSPYLADAMRGWFENGGGPCWIAGAGEGGPLAGYEAALAALDVEVTIVVTPDLWESQDDGAVIAKAVARHCVDARNRMALLHTKKDAEPAKVPALLGLDGEEAQFTTVYYPWLTVNDGNGGEKAVPPSGHVAGVWARVDGERGVHKTPANTAVRGAAGLQHSLTDSEHGELNDAGVNALRVFPGQGVLVWGARTLASDTEWKYLSVRRLANYLYASIVDGTSWASFESNGDELQAAVRAQVATFLTAQWRRGALQGARPAEAFFVICDDSNNPSDSAGALSIDVGFAAVRPAEFVQLRITQVMAAE
ncbi:phage tail sheath subtilisin-like domain-containing protein [Streptomyces sp. NPDC093982]|uniref:phage tail sheath family protein n=1 Tax=Streptomyces sp. NPDC093982 TaxID=3155077 RepID=UPI00341E8490